MMNITAKIQKLRKEKGWSVARLARETDIPTVSLRVMLAREDPNNYNVVTLQRIADVFGVTVSYLTREDGDSDRPHLTDTQKAELLLVIDTAISNYFDLDSKKKNK